MKWRTAATELFGCEYPILQGALSGLGNWRFAAAVSQTGALGCITAHVSRTPERLREDIRRYYAATNKPVLVNFSIGACPQIDDMLDVVLDEGIPVVETSVYDAGKYGTRIKQAGRKWIHKAAIVKHAMRAEEQGADAVIIVGLEGIGFKNPRQLTTMTTLLFARKLINIPIIIAGGLGDARSFLGALAMGAAGIMMGTRFMATKECPIADHHKETMVKTSPDHPQLRHTCLDMPDFKDYEEIMKLREELPFEEWLSRLERVMLKERNWRDAPLMWGKSPEQYDLLSGAQSMAVVTIDNIPTCKELIETIIQEAEKILDSLEFLKTKFA